VVSGANPFEGATVVNLSPAVAEELGLDPFGGKGVLISKVSAGVAQRVGLRPGDLIRAVNGRSIETVRDLTGAVAVRASVWQFTIERNGQQVTATVRT
jgi:S1-C subfamily serine protease